MSEENAPVMKETSCINKSTSWKTNTTARSLIIKSNNSSSRTSTGWLRCNRNCARNKRSKRGGKRSTKSDRRGSRRRERSGRAKRKIAKNENKKEDRKSSRTRRGWKSSCSKMKLINFTKLLHQLKTKQLGPILSSSRSSSVTSFLNTARSNKLSQVARRLLGRASRQPRKTKPTRIEPITAIWLKLLPKAVLS